jgi:hypothetical protein
MAIYRGVGDYWIRTVGFVCVVEFVSVELLDRVLLVALGYLQVDTYVSCILVHCLQAAFLVYI